MKVHVLFFAALRERRGHAEEWVEVTPGTTLQELYSQLFGAEPERALPVAFTQNQTVVSGRAVVGDGDEVSFLPPLGGG